MPRLNPFARGALKLIRLWEADLGDHVAALAWSPDGSMLASASISGPIHIYEAGSGSLRHALPGHGFGTTAIGFAASGRHFASGGQDGWIRLWDVGSGQELEKMSAGSAWVERLAWCPKEDLLAAAAGKKLRLWNAQGEAVREYPDHPSTIADIQWKPGEAILASAAYEVVNLWAKDEAQPIKQFHWKGSHLALAFSPDGKFIATGDQDATVHFWIMGSGEDLQMSGYPTKVRELSWNHTCRYLATGGGPTPCIWDCGGAGPAGTSPIQLEAHDALVTALTYQHQGPILATAGEDGLLALWNPAQGRGPLAKLKCDGGLTQAAWSRNDKTLAVGGDKGIVAVFALG